MIATLALTAALLAPPSHACLDAASGARLQRLVDSGGLAALLPPGWTITGTAAQPEALAIVVRSAQGQQLRAILVEPRPPAADPSGSWFAVAPEASGPLATREAAQLVELGLAVDRAFDHSPWVDCRSLAAPYPAFARRGYVCVIAALELAVLLLAVALGLGILRPR